MLDVNKILKSQLNCVFDHVLNTVKENLFANNFLRANVSGVNFCKNIGSFNLGGNSPYHCVNFWEVCSRTSANKLHCVNMSLRSMVYTSGATENAGVSNKQKILFKGKSWIEKPLAQNLLAQLISGLILPFCKDVIKKQNNTAVDPLSNVEENMSGDKCVNSKVVLNMHPINLESPYWRQRQRTISEQSDDICFLEDDESNNKLNCDYFATCYDDDDDYDDVAIKDDSDGKNKIDINKIDAIITCSNDFKNQGKIKKVRFNLNAEVHTMVTWSFAYKSARMGHWESLARDRDRFRKRIEHTSKYLNPILRPEHRSFIYNTRFSNGF